MLNIIIFADPVLISETQRRDTQSDLQKLIGAIKAESLFSPESHNMSAKIISQWPLKIEITINGLMYNVDNFTSYSLCIILQNILHRIRLGDLYIVNNVNCFGKSQDKMIDTGFQKFPVVVMKGKYAEILEQLQFPADKIPEEFCCTFCAEVMDFPIFVKETPGTKYEKRQFYKFARITRDEGKALFNPTSRTTSTIQGDLVFDNALRARIKTFVMSAIAFSKTGLPIQEFSDLIIKAKSPYELYNQLAAEGLVPTKRYGSLEPNSSAIMFKKLLPEEEIELFYENPHLPIAKMDAHIATIICRAKTPSRFLEVSNFFRTLTIRTEYNDSNNEIIIKDVNGPENVDKLRTFFASKFR